MIVLDPLMTTPDGGPASEPAGDPLLSDEPTLELVVRARSGDRVAMEALLERCMPPLKRWAHGRLPAAARGRLDTGDLVQEAALHVLGNLDTFEPRHVGAMQAYLRQSVINRIRDEVRRIGRQPWRRWGPAPVSTACGLSARRIRGRFQRHIPPAGRP